jgi:hypothetical protein
MLTPCFPNILRTKVGYWLIVVVELYVGCLSTTGAAVYPPLMVLWDAAQVVKKDRQFDYALAPLDVGVHIAPSAQAAWLASP